MEGLGASDDRLRREAEVLGGRGKRQGREGRYRYSTRARLLASFGMTSSTFSVFLPERHDVMGRRS